MIMMKTRILFSVLVLGSVLLTGGSLVMAGQDSAQKQKSTHDAQPSDDSEKAEGQKRFQQNCGRCHRAPEALSRRATPAILMHMRVRATLTAEDQRLILKFMTQ
jgi:mono/diheme cytochrome c family protein